MPAPTSKILDHIAFLKSFLSDPANVGAISPSSKALAEAMIEGCALEDANAVVELGPGLGAFTELIRDRLKEEATFIALELHAPHAQCLKERFPGTAVYHDSAEHIQKYLARHGTKRADCIVSGLPWASLASGVRKRCLEAILRSLAPDGKFTTFGYLHARWLPSARQFREDLQRCFRHVEISAPVWRNVPPAFVYRCSGGAMSSIAE